MELELRCSKLDVIRATEGAVAHVAEDGGAALVSVNDGEVVAGVDMHGGACVDVVGMYGGACVEDTAGNAVPEG